MGIGSPSSIDNVDKLQISTRQCHIHVVWVEKLTLYQRTLNAQQNFYAHWRDKMSIEDRVANLNVKFPNVVESKGNYVSYKIVDSLLYISGQLCLGADGKIAEEHKGQLGSKITESSGNAAARLCLLTVLAHVRLAVGSLDRLKSCVRLGGFVNSTPEYTALGAVMNGASDAIVEIMGEAGRHSRTTIGVATLPLGSCVEVEAVFELHTN